jgi:hypothetical protein
MMVRFRFYSGGTGLKSPLSLVVDLSLGLVGVSVAAVGLGVGVGVDENALSFRIGSIIVGLGAIVGLGVGGQNGGLGVFAHRLGTVGGGDSTRVGRGATMVGLGVGVGEGVGFGVISPCVSPPDINGNGFIVQSGGIGPLSGHFGGVGGNGFIVQSGGIGPLSGQSRAIILLPPPLRVLS